MPINAADPQLQELNQECPASAYGKEPWRPRKRKLLLIEDSSPETVGTAGKSARRCRSPSSSLLLAAIP